MLPFTQPLLTSLKDKKEGICFTGVPVTTPHHYSLTLRVVMRLGTNMHALNSAEFKRFILDSGILLHAIRNFYMVLNSGMF